MGITSTNYFEPIDDDTCVFEYHEIKDWSLIRKNQPFILVENEIRDNDFRVYNNHNSADDKEFISHYASHVWPAGQWIVKQKHSY